MRPATLLAALGLTLLLPTISQATPNTPPKPPAAAIASAHPLATQAGMDILAQGGNAFDAAVAVAASLGVVEPYSAGIGGGGFWLIYQAKQDRYRFIDAREMAPAAAHRDYYLDAQGQVDRDKAVNGPTAAAIPGQAAAFDHLATQYGKLPLATSLKAAIHQARRGFPVDAHYRKLMGFRHKAIQRYPESARLFLDNNRIPETGFIIRQPELANTLTALAVQGRKGFYQGATAKRLVNAVQKHGGDWVLNDLKNYRLVERQPIRTTIQNGNTQHTLISAPPPSSGGVALGQIMSMLSQYDWQAMDNVQQTHLISEIMRRAYHDRAKFLGDPDFVEVPVEKLLSSQHNQQWLKSLNQEKATPSLSLQGPKNLQEGFHTTHLSVLDQYGNMVSATLSINLPFGSAFTARGTGVLLNNEMDDFSAKPGSPNAYGLVGAEANAIAPGKRPLSSMSPSIVTNDESTAIIGTPGGSRIITMVALGILEHLQGKPVGDWVSRSRFHHQYLPDQIQHEPDTFSFMEKRTLQALGHELKSVGRRYGNMQAILWNKKDHQVTAASDPRGIGSAQVTAHPTGNTTEKQ